MSDELLARSPIGTIWANLPVLQERVDPFQFTQRMALYRLLVDSTNSGGLFGTNNNANVFWGYAFQLHWQWRSGRYVIAEGKSNDDVHPNSAWAYGNYTLSVLPYLAAVKEGLVPALDILPPTVSSRLAYVSGGRNEPLTLPPEFEKPVEAWRPVFRLITAVQAGGDIEPIRFALWKAHEASLKAAEPGTAALAAFQSRLECEFLQGWVRMVDFLGTAAWRTDLEFMLINGLDVLPERVLRDDDVPGQIPDMNEQVNANLKSIFSLVRQPDWRYAFNLWLWKRAMRKREARDQVLEMLAAQFQPTPENAAARRRLLRYTLAL